MSDQASSGHPWLAGTSPLVGTKRSSGRRRRRVPGSVDLARRILRQTTTTITFVLAVLTAGCGAAHTKSTPIEAPVVLSSTAAAAPPPPTHARARTRAIAAPRRRHHARVARGPSPATLPQTSRLPSGHTHKFAAEMRALWRAIRAGSLRPGRAAFFPERAYAQVKAIAYPAADYEDRLLLDYRLDLAAAHGLLGAGARTARLVAVRVHSAHWVSPQVCDNRVGYYEAPNSRLIYRTGGEVRSIGIASMISWRGIWYVIHLGAVQRPAAVGMIDDPSSGPGTSTSSSTC